MWQRVVSAEEGGVAGLGESGMGWRFRSGNAGEGRMGFNESQRGDVLDPARQQLNARAVTEESVAGTWS